MSMDKCPGHYKDHVYGRNGPGHPVHGHCPVPLPALGTSSTSQSHIHNDPMDMDEMEIGYSSGNEQEFNFLVTKPKKSKRKFNINPLALIDRILFDREDDVEYDDGMDFIDDDDLGQNVSFEAP